MIHALFLTWDFTAGHFDYEFCCMEIVEACRDLLLQFFRSFQLEMEVRLKRNSPLSLLLMAEVPFPVSFRVLSVHGSFDHWSRWCPFADN